MSYRVRSAPLSAWEGAENLDTNNNERRKPLCTLSSASWQRLEDKWNEIQVGRQGSYSVERLESLQYYCETMSTTRVFLVCVLTPLPALSCLLLLECLPLRPPSEGWAANWMFWIRMGLMVFTLSLVGVSDLILFVPNLGFTLSKRIIVSFGSAVSYVGACVLLAKYIVGFPIPFMWQFGGLLLGISLPLLLVLVLGRAPFRSDSPFRYHFQRYIRLFFGFVTLAGVYPLYKVMYDLAPVQFRGGALIALPLWKFAAKHFIMWSSREFEDFMPAIVSLSVDLFSALFVSVCISTSGSLYLSVLFIATDVGQTLLEFREVLANATTVVEILRAQEGSLQNKNTNTHDALMTPNLITRITTITRNPRAFNVLTLKRTRLWACLPHRMTVDQEKQMDVLEGSRFYGPRGLISSRRSSRTRHKSRHISLSFGLLKSAPIVPGFTSSTNKIIKRGEKSRQVVLQGLQLLFHCEYLALVEYIECIVPLVFATYKLVLHQLPNAVYYPASSNWGVAAIVNILVYAALEVGSLLLLHYFLQKKFIFSPLYQLAFALETQMYLVQALLFLEIVILLQYELEHLGKRFFFVLPV